MTTATLHLLTPEIVLIAAAVAIYLGGAFSAARRAWSWIAGLAVALAAAALWPQHGRPRGRRTAQPRRAGLVRTMAGAGLRRAVGAAGLPAAGHPTARPSTSARCC